LVLKNWNGINRRPVLDIRLVNKTDNKTISKKVQETVNETVTETVINTVNDTVNESEEYILTVDEQDREIGYMEKLKVHQLGLLHRAFSVMVFNPKGEVLLQKRATLKYHSPGLWSNTCCSHQREGESLVDAVSRRLQDELGFLCECKEIFQFKYQVKFDNGLTEYEIDHVFFGQFNGEVIPNRDEVEEIKWVNMDDLKNEMKEYPERFTYWFQILMDQPQMLREDNYNECIKQTCCDRRGTQ
jgi:isopentenyl-diphosphate Delta-isomerase